MKSINHWPLTILHSLIAITKLFLPLVLVRIFSLQEIGEYKLFWLYLVIVPEFFGTSALAGGLGYWGGQQRRLHYITAALVLGMVSSVLAPVLLVLYSTFFGPVFSSFYFELAFLVNSAIIIPRLLLEELLVVNGDVWRSAGYRVVGEVFRVVMLVLVVSQTRDLGLALFVASGGSAIELGCYVWRIIAKRSNSLSRASVSDFVKVFSYLVPVAFSGLAVILFERFDQIFLSHVLTPEDFALYAIGCLAIPPLFVLEQSVTRVLIPALAKSLTSTEKKSHAIILFRSSVAQLAFFLVPSAIFISVFSHPITIVLFTSRYERASQFLSLYALTYVFLVFPYDVFPRALGKSGWLFRFHLLAGCLSVLSVAIGGALNGPFGALVGLCFSQASIRFLALSQAAQELRVSRSDLIPLFALLKISVSSLLAIVCSVPLFFTQLSSLTLVVAGGISFSIGFLVMWILFPLKTSSRVLRDVPPTIIQLTQFLATGGLERLVMNLAIRLNATQRWQCEVVSYDVLEHSNSTELQNELEGKGVRVHQLMKKRRFSISTVLQLQHIIAREGVSILHTHDLGSLIYGSLAKCLSI
ncbi:MAG: hypothetical protein KDD60_06470, partial [Bdellovibrionales bacterium]|nr:hypothetical protein [Bdellovibrionales bacterium]